MGSETESIYLILNINYFHCSAFAYLGHSKLILEVKSVVLVQSVGCSAQSLNSCPNWCVIVGYDVHPAALASVLPDLGPIKCSGYLQEVVFDLVWHP